MIKIQEVIIKTFLKKLYLGKVYSKRVCLGRVLKSNQITLGALMQATDVYISELSMFVNENSALPPIIKQAVEDKECVQKEIKEYSRYVPLDYSINGFFTESSNSKKLEKLLCSIAVLYLTYEKIKMNPRASESNSFSSKLNALGEKIYELLIDVLTISMIVLRLDVNRHGYGYSEEITRFTQARHFFQETVHSIQNIEERLSKYLYCSPYVLYNGSKQDSVAEDFAKEDLDIQQAVKKLLDPDNAWHSQELPYPDNACGPQV